MPYIYTVIRDDERIDLNSRKLQVRENYIIQLLKGSKWCVDRDQQSFLVSVHADREPPFTEWLAFWFRKQVFTVGQYHKSIRLGDGRFLQCTHVIAAYPENTDATLSQEDLGAMTASLREALITRSSSIYNNIATTAAVKVYFPGDAV